MTWTQEDEAHALRQGWSLFGVDSGDVVIQKMDDPASHYLWIEGMPEVEVFSSDNAAIRFVRKAARSGDATAQKAIAIHDANYKRWDSWRRRHYR